MTRKDSAVEYFLTIPNEEVNHKIFEFLNAIGEGTHENIHTEMTDAQGIIHRGIYIQPDDFKRIKTALKKPPLNACTLLSRRNNENFKVHCLSPKKINLSTAFVKGILRKGRD